MVRAWDVQCARAANDVSAYIRRHIYGKNVKLPSWRAGYLKTRKNIQVRIYDWLWLLSAFHFYSFPAGRRGDASQIRGRPDPGGSRSASVRLLLPQQQDHGPVWRPAHLLAPSHTLTRYAKKKKTTKKILSDLTQQPICWKQKGFEQPNRVLTRNKDNMGQMG